MSTLPQPAIQARTFPGALRGIVVGDARRIRITHVLAAAMYIEVYEYALQDQGMGKVLI